MTKRTLLGSILALSILAGAVAVSAQDTTLPPLVAVVDNNVKFIDSQQVVQISTNEDPTMGVITDIAWSDDGSRLLYVDSDENGRQLMLASTDGTIHTMIAQHVAALPPTFSPDGTSILYTMDGTFEEIVQGADGMPVMPTTIYSQTFDPATLEPTGEAQEVGVINIGTGCGGGSAFPMDIFYSEDAGYGGNPSTFMVVNGGILHSNNCSGIGLSWFDPETGEDRILSQTITRADLSASGEEVVGIEIDPSTREVGNIVVLNLTTGEVTYPVTDLQATPDRVAWADDGSIYYTTRAMLPDPLPVSDAAAEVLTNQTGLNPSEIPQYQVGITEIAPDGTQTPLYQGQGWAIGRLLPQDDALFFSLIPDGTAWVNGLAEGTIDMTQPEGYYQLRAAVAPTIYLLDPSGAASPVFTGASQASFQPEM